MCSSLILGFCTVVAAAVVALRLYIMLSCLSELYTSEAIHITSVDIS